MELNKCVEFSTAKLLKEKGFDLPTDKYYEHSLTSKKDSETNDFTGTFGWKKGETNLSVGFFVNNKGMADLSNGNWYMCSAPTIAEVVMWLYEKKSLWILALPTVTGYFAYKIVDVQLNPKNPIERPPYKDVSANDYNSPTEAYEAAIEYTLNNLI